MIYYSYEQRRRKGEMFLEIMKLLVKGYYEPEFLRFMNTVQGILLVKYISLVLLRICPKVLLIPQTYILYFLMQLKEEFDLDKYL